MTDERRQRAITSTPKLSPDEVANRTFSSSFRGVAEAEVKAFLRRVADELTEARRRHAELEAALEQAEETARTPRALTEDELLDALGEETSRLLHTARDAARDIRSKAEENAARLLAEAQADTQRMRDDAEGLLALRTGEAEAAAAEIRQAAADDDAARRAETERHTEALRERAAAEIELSQADAARDAERELDDARERARVLVDTARDLRERVLADLSHRRALLTDQINELRAGREKLLEAYRTVKRSFLDATDALAQVEGRAAEVRPAAVDPETIAAAYAAEPAAADDAAPELAEAVEPEAAEPEAVVSEMPTGPDGEPADDGAALPDPDALFARIRAERERATETPAPAESAAAATGVEAADSAGPDAPDEAVATDEAVAPDEAVDDEPFDDSPSGRAARAVAGVLAPALKRAKRVAQDDQNALLDALRRQKGRAGSESVLPGLEDHARSWAAALDDAAGEAYSAGRADIGAGAAPAPAGLTFELTRDVLDPVRARLASAIDDAADTGAAIETISARSREFRSQQLEGAVIDVLAGAYARGAFDAAAEGTMLQWVLAASGCSADCADNALEPTLKGAEFPTGHRYPPAYAGCRCSLTVAVVSVD